MNIFVLDTNPRFAAQMHCDQHVHKMILESAQILSSACHLNGFEVNASTGLKLYRPAYLKHPCVQWAQRSVDHMSWLVTLCDALQEERILRFGSPIHMSFSIIDSIRFFLARFYPSSHWSAVDNFTFCGSLEISILALSTPQKYQLYYKQKALEWTEKKTPMSYTYTSIPEFLQQSPVQQKP